MENYNLLITNVSKVKYTNYKKKDYLDERNNELTGYMTNEAPIISVIKRLKDNDEELNEIIFICSDTVRDNLLKKDDDKTGYFNGTMNSVSILQKRIKEWLLKNYFSDDKPTFQEISIADEPNEENLTETINKVRERILSLINDPSEADRKVNLFIEANGGVRYVLTMLLSITRSLELTHKDRFEIKETLSMVLSDEGNTPVRIKNTKRIFDTAQISGLIDEFINYGRIESLKKYFLKDNTHVAIRNMITALESVSDNIQLCRTEQMLENFYGNENIKTQIEGFLARYNDTDKIFSMVLKEIRDEIDHAGRNVAGSDTIMYLPRMIQWCLDKSFMQQALTLCAERTAEYLMKKEILKPLGSFEVALNSTDTREYSKAYYFLAHITEFTGLIGKAKANAFLEGFKDNFYTDLNIDIDEPSDPNTPDSRVIRRFSTDISLEFNRNNYNDTYERIRDDLKEYIDNNRIRFADSYWGAGLLNKTVHISSKKSAEFQDILNGNNVPVYLQESTPDIGRDTNIRLERSKRVLMFLISEAVNKNQENSITECTTAYEGMIHELFGENPFAEALINKYAEAQARKYYILEALEHGLISSSSEDNVQKILYMYSLCKEQRNFSNHATVNNDDLAVAMNSDQIRILIEGFLNTLNV